ncbi:MAG: DegT/DnrJ/EryC1/StrS family aminotransferase [Myxococcota bacterium]|nr:DegT/DnrJ/EryC1/StrS family aminotransferase [Myxococcota bacterium]
MTRVPLIDLAAQEATIAVQAMDAIAAVAREAAFIRGARVEAFEQWLTRATRTSHAVGVASGTDAIELSLRALGVAQGDAVVTPAFSFIAAAEAIAATGARPVFCDVDPTTWSVTPRTVADAVKRARGLGLRVRAAVPVSLFGRCAVTSELGALGREEGFFVVEDAAQALGACDASGRAAGSTGHVGCFSFFPTKTLGAWGDGGAIVTSDGELAARARRLGAHGAVSPFVHQELGRNSRLDALQAAILLAKAPHLAAWHAARTRAAARYVGELGGLPLALPSVPAPPAVHAWHAFVVRVPSRRDELALWLREHGIETRVYYPVPLHRQACFRALAEPALPESEEACRTALALPLFASITDAQQGWVIEQIAKFFRRGASGAGRGG